jgi:hypothetical protein
MYYAQIKSGVVENVIKLDDVNLLPTFSSGYDSVIDITSLNPMPSVGWLYDGNNFSEVVPNIPPVDEAGPITD